MADELPLFKRSKTRTNGATEETVLGPSDVSPS